MYDLNCDIALLVNIKDDIKKDNPKCAHMFEIMKNVQRALSICT